VPRAGHQDAHYPWLLLVPRRPRPSRSSTSTSRTGAVDDGDFPGRRALKEITKCDKLNIAALGNLVPQLHIHVIARRSGDVAWPRPVWGVMPPLAHDAEEKSKISSARFAAKSGLVEDHDSHSIRFPWGSRPSVHQYSRSRRASARR